MSYVGQRCKCGHIVKIMRSASGYYLGTSSNENGYEEPYCRLSNYFKTEELAKEQAYPCRDSVLEIQYCNDGNGCISL